MEIGRPSNRTTQIWQEKMNQAVERKSDDYHQLTLIRHSLLLLITIANIYIMLITGHILSKHFTCINSHKPQTYCWLSLYMNKLKYAEGLSNLLKIMQQVSGRSRIQIQSILQIIPFLSIQDYMKCFIYSISCNNFTAK